MTVKTTVDQAQTNTQRFQVPASIVTPAWLHRSLDHPGLRVVDMRDRDSYETGHIPGAVWADLTAMAETVDGVQGILLAPEKFAAQISTLGIENSTAVVIYDENWGMPASRIFWALERYGHKNAAILTGGFERWTEEGLPASTDPTTPPQREFTPQPDNEHYADYAWIKAHLDNPDVVLLDTRSLNEFAAGQLPGAVHWDWLNAIPQEGWDVFRPLDTLFSELVEAGITPDKEVVTYCRSGMRAAHTYLLLRTLGYSRVRLYDGSWLEWSHLNGQ